MGWKLRPRYPRAGLDSQEPAGAQLNQHLSLDTPPAPTLLHQERHKRTHPVPILVPNSLTTCSIRSLMLVVEHCWWRGKRSKSHPHTPGQHRPFFSFFNKQNKMHTFNIDEVFQDTLVSTCCQRL